MSLTGLIGHRRDIREFLVSTVKEIPKMPTIAKGQFTNISNYALVGTAFDYAFRFELLRIYPFAKEAEWVAKAGANLILENLLPYSQKWQMPALMTLKGAKEAREDYIKNPTTSKLRRMVEMCFRLSWLDWVYRDFTLPSVPVPDENLMPNPQRADVDDVISMLNRSKKFMRSKRFKGSSTILLNPTFGEYSKLVGGADADIITSTSLIDLKTSTMPRIGDYELAQIVGYYALLQLNNFNPLQFPPEEMRDFPDVREVGLFFPRYGAIYCIPADNIELNEERLMALIELIRSSPASEPSPLEKLYGIASQRSKTLNDMGIKTIEDLAKVDSSAAKTNLVNGIRLEKLSAIARNYIDHKFILRNGISVDMAEKLFNFDDEVYLDIETTGLFHDSQIWLIGMLFRKTGKLIQLFAESPEKERTILKQYLSLFKSIRGKIVIFSGNFFDLHFIEARLKQYRFPHESQSAYYVDALNTIREMIVIPSKNNLKEMASWMGYRFKHEDLAGFMMPGLYNQYLLTWDEELKIKLKEYNEDDVRSLMHVVGYIRSGLVTMGSNQ